MVDVMTSRTVLSDSNFKARPHFDTYLRSDASAGGNTVEQIQRARLARQMKFPTLVGRKDVDSFKDPQNPTDTGYIKYNDEGDHRVNAPFRSCDNIIDPVSGFVSVAGDADRGTGRTKLRSMVQIPTTPQTSTPQAKNTVRMYRSAPPELRRSTDRDPGGPYPWNGRRVLDANLRASLGGWTSAKDPRIVEEEKLRGDVPRTPGDENKELRDRLAKKFMYTSSVQRAYEEVPWDNMLEPKKWPPTTAQEERPDMISQTFTRKRYDPAANQWQNVGRSWDWFQTRNGHYKTDIPIPGIVFCAPLPRAGQIPGYSGCIGGDNILEIENVKESFNPYTVKRVPIPRPTETAHRPNIPKYTGCTLYRPETEPAHANVPPPNPMTTARVHTSMPVTPNTSEYRKDSQMSKMVTTVPPCNPFNLIKSEHVVTKGVEPVA